MPLTLSAGNVHKAQQGPNQDLPSAWSAMLATTPIAMDSPAAHHVPWATLPVKKAPTSVLPAPRDTIQRSQEPRNAGNAHWASLQHSQGLASVSPVLQARLQTRLEQQNARGARQARTPPGEQPTRPSPVWTALPGSTPTRRGQLPAWTAH